jgi:hypothetical protein
MPYTNFTGEPPTHGWDFGFVGAAYGASYSMTTANDRIAAVFQCPFDGDLDWFEFRIAGLAAPPSNGIRYSFQDVSALGFPDNTDDQFAIIPVGSLAVGWQPPTAYLGSTGAGSGTRRTVTKGQWLACVARFQTFVAGDTVTISSVSYPGVNAVYYIGTKSTNAGVSYINPIQAISVTLKYQTLGYVTVVPKLYPWNTTNTLTYNSGSTPDEIGNIFIPAVNCRLQGVRIKSVFSGVAASYSIIVYDSGSVSLGTLAIVGQHVNGGTGNSVEAYFVFPGTVTLTAGATYRIVLRPDAGSNCTLEEMVFQSNAYLGGGPGGINMYKTSRTNAGAWTDDNVRKMGIFPMLAAVDTGSAAVEVRSAYVG